MIPVNLAIMGFSLSAVILLARERPRGRGNRPGAASQVVELSAGFLAQLLPRNKMGHISHFLSKFWPGQAWIMA